MRVVIVDDDALARRQLKMYLRAHQDIEVVGEADGGLMGVEEINRLKPDLVFLDIEMPDINGFDILPYLEEKPIIIFSSNFDQYALKAFDIEALDYVLKPVESERLARALLRVRQQLAPQADLTGGGKHLDKLIAREGTACRVLWIKDVMVFRKSGRYTEVVLERGGTSLVELSLETLEERVSTSDFYRINRQVMVRKSWVVRMSPGPAASGLIVTGDEQEYSVSRGRWKGFKSWFLEAE